MACFDEQQTEMKSPSASELVTMTGEFILLLFSTSYFYVGVFHQKILQLIYNRLCVHIFTHKLSVTNILNVCSHVTNLACRRYSDRYYFVLENRIWVQMGMSPI